MTLSGESGKVFLRIGLTLKNQQALRTQGRACVYVTPAYSEDHGHKGNGESSWEVGHALFCRWHLVEGDAGTIQIPGLGTDNRLGVFKSR